MRAKAEGSDVVAAINLMLLSNQNAGKLIQAHGCSACTDVTGFGLLGHLLEMIEFRGSVATRSDCTVRLDITKIPILRGAREAVTMGIFSSLQSEVRLYRSAASKLLYYH
jgi:selenide,water dikinase